MTLCYVCGWNFKETYSGGDICSCCGSEYDFSDCLEKEEILEKYCGNDKEKLHIIAPELDGVDDEEEVARDITWRFLRLAWVKKGCPFKWAKEEGIENWTIKDAKKQLDVIGYKYDSLVPLANKIISD
jgi:hypothetical protein